MKQWTKYLLLFGILLLLIDSNRFYHHFSRQVADSDQSLFWLYAEDLAEGEIHSPFLYGQDYNIPLESIIAAPLVKAGMSAYKALPFTSLILGLLPFILFSLYFYRKEHYVLSLISLSIPLLLPLEWTVMASMPRGFIGGIFMASLASLLYLWFQSKTMKVVSLFLLFLAFLVNPNSILLILPFVLLLALRKQLWHWPVLLALSLALLCYLGLSVFKLQHQDVLVHQAWTIEWQFSTFKEAMMQSGRYFHGMIPFVFKAGAFMLPALLLLTILLFVKRTKHAAILSASLLCLILFSLGVNKVSDGTESVFYPYARMFLGIPFAVLLVLSSLKLNNQRNAILAVAFLMLMGFGLRQLLFKHSKQWAIQENSAVVQLFNPSSLKEDCKKLKDLLEKEQAQLMLFCSQANQYNYGCAGISSLPSLYPAYERRWWVWSLYSQLNLNQLIIIDWENERHKMFKDLSLEKIPDTPFPAYRILESNALLMDYVQP